MDLDALIKQLQLGDPNAGAILVSVVAPRLLGYVGLVAPDLGPADHEEIVEKAIEKAVVKIDRFDPAKGTFPAWTRTFVRYEVLTWRRSHLGGAHLPLTDADTLPVPDEMDDATADELSDQETAIAFQVLVLPEASQLLLRLRYAEKLDFPAIAKQLDISHDAARKRHQRIIEELRSRAADDPNLKHLGGDR